MGDGVDREGDAVLHADFAHEFGHVRLHRAFFNAQGGTDFFVRAPGHQHFQDFFFAVGEADAARREDAPGGGTDALDEHGEDAARGPDRALVDDADGLHKFGGGSGFVDVALGAGSDGFENGFFIHARAGDDDAEVGTRGLEAGHQVEQVLSAAITQQNQVDVLNFIKIYDEHR